MTIKTVIRRENHLNKIYVATCSKCGSEFEATEDDIKWDPDSYSASNSGCGIGHTRCPECGDEYLQFILTPPGNE